MIDRTALKPILRPKKKSRAIRTPIRKQSRRRAKESALYAKLSKEFLAAHPVCQHWCAEHGVNEEGGHRYKITRIGTFAGLKELTAEELLWFGAPRSTEIHHQKGRGKFYLDTSTWMAVRPGHENYIHNDPKRYEKGYCLPRR